MSAENSANPPPCELPCPKCGSLDVARHFRAAGKSWTTHNREVENPHAEGHMWLRTAKVDHIEHHCRCCQHDWQTEPLRGQNK